MVYITAYYSMHTVSKYFTPAHKHMVFNAVIQVARYFLGQLDNPQRLFPAHPAFYPCSSMTV